MPPSNPVHHLRVDKRIADPVHGLIRLTAIEAEVLQTPIFQRLRGISQLGMAPLVYPGATHTRFSHSLGVLQNATAIFDVAYRNWLRNPEIAGDIDADLLFSEEMLQITRLAAMCHDLGHLPFSHNLEPTIDWLAATGHIPEVFRHEDLSVVMIQDLLGPILGEMTSRVADMIGNRYQSFQTCLFPAFVVSSAIDADRMDYLLRDALYTGVDQGRYDRERLLDSVIPYRTRIGQHSYDVLGFHAKGIEAIEQFLLARHRMHQTVYFNPSSVGFEAALQRAYYQISTSNPPWELPHVFLEDASRLLEFDEATLMTQLRRELRDRNSWLVNPLLHRQPLRKFGPFYHTQDLIFEAESERFELLSQFKSDLENPPIDWHDKDHWMYAEHKKQRLVDPLPDAIEAITPLKNVILLVNAMGDLVDATDVAYGHTFLPHITQQVYHRFMFYTRKQEGDRLQNALEPIITRYGEFSSRPLP